MFLTASRKIQVTLADIGVFYKVNKIAVDSLLGYEQFNTQPRPAKIAALCTIARNRDARVDVHFIKKPAADILGEVDEDAAFQMGDAAETMDEGDDN